MNHVETHIKDDFTQNAFIKVLLNIKKFHMVVKTYNEFDKSRCKANPVASPMTIPIEKTAVFSYKMKIKMR